MNVQDNYQTIRSNIDNICRRTGRDPDEINVIAVTKYVGIDRAEAAIEAGVRHLGENRDEGLKTKYQKLGDKAAWHFIGSLQTRRVKNIIDKVEYIHSLDRISLAKEIDKRALGPMKCFIQVNVSGEESKHGCSPQDLMSLVKAMRELPSIQVVGLMTMAPLTDDKDLIRTCFKQLKELQQSVQAQHLPTVPCHELSMGMSNDYDIAIEEGATFIRIGTSLVGNEIGGV